MASSIGNRSLIHWRTGPGDVGDTPEEVLSAVCARLRELNRDNGARELSLAITHCEEAGHWLRALAERKGSR